MLQGFGGFLFYRVIFRSKLANAFVIKGFETLCILRAYYAHFSALPHIGFALCNRAANIGDAANNDHRQCAYKVGAT